MTDLRAAAVDILTLGQYLRPTPNHLGVERFVTPAEFAQYREWALECGFLECVSGPWSGPATVRKRRLRATMRGSRTAGGGRLRARR